ncbi:hypothetical protein AVEN_172290-1 [Araneus ventricosus]|uniref:Uncharacterized protein n=1 Tax=Araneus ventricosus TaxID=182803 RepID=A0A4Y2TEQ6_ARAVE|nr:hypothetical protein AVEN_172290-1 [Araneus ventricosus]
MKDRPPQQIVRHSLFLHNSLHYERLMQQLPVLPGHDLSLEFCLRATPTMEREPAYLSGSNSSVGSRCPPVGLGHWDKLEDMIIKQFTSNLGRLDFCIMLDAKIFRNALQSRPIELELSNLAGRYFLDSRRSLRKNFSKS